MNNRSQANKKILKDATDIQQKTNEAFNRIQNKVEEMEGLGIQTLEELSRQDKQMDDINKDIALVGTKLDQSTVLQKKFDILSGNWIGGNKKAALREANTEIQTLHANEQSKIRKEFQRERRSKLPAKVNVFAPHGQIVNLTASGFTGTAGKKPLSKDQELDEESTKELNRIYKTDRDFDHNIDDLSAMVDSLANIAKSMKEETIEQNKKLDRMGDKMETKLEKAIVVNARQKHLLK